MPVGPGANVALKVTGSLYCREVGVKVNVAVAEALFTVCVNTGDVLEAKVLLESVKTAVIDRDPALIAFDVNDALPLVTDALPSRVVPSKNCIVPFGDPAPEVTVAVKVTDWP